MHSAEEGFCLGGRRCGIIENCAGGGEGGGDSVHHNHDLVEPPDVIVKPHM